MMPCSKETVVRLFYNSSSSFQLFFLFLYFSSILLVKFLHFLSCINPLTQRTQNGLEYGWSSEEEEEADKHFLAECEGNDHLVADIIHDGEDLVFLHNSQVFGDVSCDEGFKNWQEPVYREGQDNHPTSSQWPSSSGYCSPASELLDLEDAVDEEDAQGMKVDSVHNPCLSKAERRPTSPTIIELNKPEECRNENIGKGKGEQNFSSSGYDESYLIFAPTHLETKKFQPPERDFINEDIFGDSCTVGSTSKSSSEWRSSIINRDSGTDDPFSSSSRRSCPKWESYAVFQKYDEEMTFLSRLSAQKLHETESLRSIRACPRSISEQIVHKLAIKNSIPTDGHRNPYHELESSYVAQICLTWEALNWNYTNFQSKSVLRRQWDPGCPARIAQDYQQFQVLLQRYIENEPYEHGRRPEVYARFRKVAPKLLLVPEYRDSEEDEEKEEGFGSRIPSASFQKIMEDGIRTFMNFLKADRENYCQVLRSFFGKNPSGSVDPTILLLYKKAYKKKKINLEDLRRARRCLRKRKLKRHEEMEILMGLIDLKVVSRVLRMASLREEQLQWCEHKINKLRILGGKLQRDSSPLFFPAR